MKKVCVIGYPAKHSLSPVIHNYWIEKYGIEGKYEIREIEPDKFNDFLRNLHKEGYIGCNITLPYKEIAFALRDGLFVQNNSKDIPIGFIAKMSGAVNTIIMNDGKLIGSNTDCFGFYENIKKNEPKFNFENGKAVIIGAGGAARGILQSLIFTKVSEIIILNRTRDKAEQIRNEIYEPAIKDKIRVIDWKQRHEALKDINLLINTTSLGMIGQPPLDIDLSLLPKEALVTDIVYRPLITPLLKAAQEHGNSIVDGLGMLLYQAVPGFNMWFDEELKAKGIDGVEVTPELRQIVIDAGNLS